jgi:hypothetical protein
MNINAYETDSRQYPNRDNSIATIETRSTTTSKKLMLNTRGSISSATSSTRRPSAPLSIAERFMSPNYNSADTIITMKDESLEEKRSNVMTSCSDIGAPNNRNAYDRLSPMSPPPLFLSSDPSQQGRYSFIYFA